MKEIERAIRRIKKLIFTAEMWGADDEEIQALLTAITALEKQLSGGWVLVSERLPDEKENLITRDYYEYTVTICICGKYGIRHYKFGRGKWWNGGADMSSIVIAWMPLPEKYKEGV